MAEWRFEARYRGVPREAGPVVGDWLREYRDREHTDVAAVQRTGLDGNGFYMRFVVRAEGSTSQVLIRALTLASLAMEYAWSKRVELDPNAQPFMVRCEELS
jgi:hypothetical protein